jgi:hypothetical protein
LSIATTFAGGSGRKAHIVDYEHGLNAAVKRPEKRSATTRAAAFHRNDSTPRLPVYRTGV